MYNETKSTKESYINNNVIYEKKLTQRVLYLNLPRKVV